MRPPESLPLKAKTFHILLALSTRAHHGYGIKKAIIERTGGAIDLDPGGLYRLIGRLEDDGLVAPALAPEDSSDVRRRYYELTALGRTTLREEAQRLSDLVASSDVSALLTQAGEGM